MSTNYTISEAADYLRCSTKTVHRRIAAGQLGCCRIGKVTIIQQAQLDRFLAVVEDAPWAPNFAPLDANPTRGAVRQGPRQSRKVSRAA